MLLAAAAGGAVGYQIERSLRFNSADSSFLSRTPASVGNRKTWSWAGWVKRTVGSSDDELFSSDSSDGFVIRFVGSTSAIRVYSNSGGGLQLNLITSAVYRDPSAWYHLVVAIDTTQATAANRAKIYVNGVQVTAFSTSAYPSQNTDLLANQAVAHYIGKNAWGASGLNAYLADLHFCDGTAYDASAFGEFDDNGIWQPKAFAGSYGSQGWHLDFADNSAATATALAKDTSGNGNNWTPNNLSVLTGGPTSIASASGALPIYNTTGTYGDTKGTGTRTDSNSSSIVLAVAMDGANNGTTFTDESATIKGSGSAKTLTRNGDTKTSTAESKFYGSSGFFDGTGDYLSSTNTDFAFGTGDFTVECWARLSSVTTEQNFVATRGAAASASAWSLAIDSSSKVYMYTDGLVATGSTSLKTSTWHHIALTRSGSALRIFVDGLQDASATNSQDFSTQTLGIGLSADGAQFPLTGYLQDVRLYKGVAKYTSNFNPPSSTQNATIAAANDSLVDVPTNGSETDTGAGGEVRGNYCTWNPLANGGLTLANGNLDASRASASWVAALATIGISSGKWYWEHTCTATQDANNISVVGVATGGLNLATMPGFTANGWVYVSETGFKYNNNSSLSYGAIWTNGDVIGIAFDADNGTLVFYKNNVSQGTAYTGLTSGPYFPVLSMYGTSSGPTNFGQRPFAYTAPSGFKALNTANLPAPVVTKPSDLFDVKLYTGNGGTQTISGLGFSPDLVWIKNRAAADNHKLTDIVRGATEELESNTTDAEATNADGLTQFNADGFDLGDDDEYNTSAEAYVAWAWDAGTSTVTNTDGSISSQVRANASAGFSIVSYTGTGTSPVSVGHGLGVAPTFLIFKDRDSAVNWQVWTTAISSSGTIFEGLNTTAAGSTPWTYISTTSSLIQFNSGNSAQTTNGKKFICYAFSPVSGYSSFGSYTGNGSADGPFVYTGFRPRWVLIKASSSVSAGSWRLFDTARDPFNVCANLLMPNNSDSEYGIGDIGAVFDILSNGFKLRSTLDAWNGSAATYIYAAFAEHPFNFSRAR
jgi:hypothetical protein